ncbi:hypothetical protein [Parasutterella excrementihominis]|uniref:hypothetical protein n=1 Tax=Parasutterella excrementihominis TaxID=487175 RepID=UPI0012BBEF48|nr:hypothetical protein [Parasutterella excrementihominis]MTT66930.1 hypothetical protein [Parasutterella excrementihominis]MTT95037.1 hypothetical protein [Parasutterella excrementihominis]
MNPITLLKLGAGALVVIGAYFFGLSQGHDSEQLKNAQAQVSQLTDTIKRYEAKQKEQVIAMVELRVSESNARTESDRMRERVASLEKRAKTGAARDTIQCLRLESEARRLLLEARSAIEYCRKALQ